AGEVLRRRRRERAERLAKLDLLVDSLLHLRRPRVGEDRAVTERTGPDLEPALEPADDLAGGEGVDGLGQHRLLVGQLAVLHAVGSLERGPDLTGRVTGAPVG